MVQMVPTSRWADSPVGSSGVVDAGGGGDSEEMEAEGQKVFQVGHVVVSRTALRTLMGGALT